MGTSLGQLGLLQGEVLVVDVRIRVKMPKQLSSESESISEPELWHRQIKRRVSPEDYVLYANTF